MPRATSTARHAFGRPVRPMLATLVDEPFDRAGWLFEMKWDGYRAVAEVGRGCVLLYSRNHESFLGHYPDVVESLKELKADAVLDGEVVALDRHGKPSFQLLQNHRRTKEGTLAYFVFDLLWLNGKDLRGLPLVERKKPLPRLLKGLPNVCFSEHVAGNGTATYEAARELGMEGVIAKDGGSRYVEGARSKSWLKVKVTQSQEAVIGGFTAPTGSRHRFGARGSTKVMTWSTSATPARASAGPAWRSCTRSSSRWRAPRRRSG
jgi:bifunctional non-homologous end joining protein LigD